MAETNRYAIAVILNLRVRKSGGGRKFRHLYGSTAPLLNDTPQVENMGDERIPGPRSVRLEQLLGGQPEMKPPGRSHLQAVVIYRQSYRSARNGGIIPMTQSVCKRLARRLGRIERSVDPLERSSFNPPGDGQGFDQKAFGTREKREGVAVELPVVQKFRAVYAAKTGDPDLAPGHSRLNQFRVAEQHRRGPKQHSVLNKPESAQYLLGFPRYGIVHPAEVNRKRHRAQDLLQVEIFNRPVGGGFVFPAPFLVHALKNRLSVLVDGHRQSGVSDPAIGDALV